MQHHKHVRSSSNPLSCKEGRKQTTGESLKTIEFGNFLYIIVLIVLLFMLCLVTLLLLLLPLPRLLALQLVQHCADWTCERLGVLPCVDGASGVRGAIVSIAVCMFVYLGSQTNSLCVLPDLALSLGVVELPTAHEPQLEQHGVEPQAAACSCVLCEHEPLYEAP